MALTDTAEQKHLSAEAGLDALVRAGGGIYAGVGEGFGCIPDLIYFHDPQTHSTLALPLAGISSRQVRRRLAESRECFAAAQDSLLRAPSASARDRNTHGKN